MPRFDLDDGRWLRMRLPTVNEHLAIIDLPTAENPTDRVERLRFWRDTFRDATEETSWGGDAGDLSVAAMFKLVQPWLGAAEDDAVPPVSGSSSGTPPPKPRSRRPTAKSRQSAGPPSSS